MKNYQYKFGGSLMPDDPTYVERQADRDLYQGLKNREYCYIFNSRQMGKSSLRVRVSKQLQDEGFICIVVDLEANVTASKEEWYGAIASRIWRNLPDRTFINLRTWWDERKFLSPLQRLDDFVAETLHWNLDENIVIFIDEIDSVLSLKFAHDDFFAWIRSCYERRSYQPEYERLTFVLLGVATPSELIEDKKITPFNIGQFIELEGFTLEEAQPLVQGFEEKFDNPQIILREILYWTGGQPFLTQKLCKLAVSDPSSVPVAGEAKWVENLVRSRIIENWEFQDNPPHLRTIRDRILDKKIDSILLLKQYKQILDGAAIKIKNKDHILQSLSLSGLIAKRNGRIEVYCPIYKEIFDFSWLQKHLNYKTKKENYRQLEIIVLGIFLLACFLVPLQELLIDYRQLLQSLYRNLTNQIPKNSSLFIQLIAIDQDSIDSAQKTIVFPAGRALPMDQEYLATIINKTTELNAKVVGINYLLHVRQPKNKESQLNKAFVNAVKNNQTWFVLAVNNDHDLFVLPTIASKSWMLKGDITFYLWDVESPAGKFCKSEEESKEVCPFSYLLNLAYSLNSDSLNNEIEKLPQPNLNSKDDFQSRVNHYLKGRKNKERLISYLTQLNSILGWRSIIDFSIPPDKVYVRTPAWQFLEPSNQLELKDKVVIITSGGYIDAEDNYSVPPALNYWRCYSDFFNVRNLKISRKEKEKNCKQEQDFTAGEVHAYMVYQNYWQHFVVPLPQYGFIILAALIGKTLALKWFNNQQYKKKKVFILVVTTVAYISIGIQAYITLSVLVPLVLPVTLFWFYIFLAIRRIENA